MKKIVLILAIVLVFLVGVAQKAQAEFEEIIKDTQSFLSILEIQNVVLSNFINYLLAVNPPSSETFIESMAYKLLLEEEQTLISKSQKLLNEMEKDKKDIEAKMTEVYRNLAKISPLHLKVIKYLSQKFDFLLKELDKEKETPI